MLAANDTAYALELASKPVIEWLSGIVQAAGHAEGRLRETALWYS